MSGKKYPANNAIIGSLALHGINGVRIDVIFLSSSFSIILEVIIPGTLHPEPTINDIKLFPLNPNLLNTLSKNNEILDIYPVVSNIAIQKNNIISCGTNPNTAPTPAIIPSTTKLVSQSEVPIASIPSLILSPKAPIASPTQSTVALPTTPTDK